MRRRFSSWSSGVTFIELAMFMLIFGILIVAVVKSLQIASKGPLGEKERLRALSLARERLEEVKNMSYSTLALRYSNYYYPEVPDPKAPLAQDPSRPPYPAWALTPAEDPWTPENILMGGTTYWRHVVVKFVEEVTAGGILTQRPLQNPPMPCVPCSSPTTIGGNDSSSNLAYIEVDVTWFSRRLGKMQQVRVTTLLANGSVPTINTGSINGTVYNDDFDRNGDGGGTTAASSGPASDDKPVSAGMIVIARDESNGATYSALTNSQGVYTISNLPNGSYYIDFRGAPYYDDSGYTNTTSEPAGTNPMLSVSVSNSTQNLKQVNVWTMPIRPFRIVGKYIGVSGSAGSPKVVQVTAADGLSLPVTTSVTWICDSANPCWFTVNNVAWPSSGLVKFRLTINNMTDGKAESATIWTQSSVASNTIFIGIGPGAETPIARNPCGYGAPDNPPGGCIEYDESSTPTVWGPMNPSGTYSSAPGSIHIKVKEYFDLQTLDLAPTSTPTGRVKMIVASAGTTSVYAVDSGGNVTITGVPPGVSGDVRLTAYMTTTGFTSDDYFLPFGVQPSLQYEMEPGGSYGGGGLPATTQQHLFVISRVAAVSGTVWAIANTKGFPNASVQIKNDATQWNTVVKADGSGRFYHAAIPKETSPYYVLPVTGADYTSVPIMRDFVIAAHGVEYRVDNFTSPMDFVLSSINGTLAGTVTRGGALVREGALVIASTYNTGTQQFVNALPSAALSGEYTFSTVTLSDGTYRMKVATGVGSYYMYASAVVDGVELFKKLTAPVAAIPDAVVTPSPDLVLP